MVEPHAPQTEDRLGVGLPEWMQALEFGQQGDIQFLRLQPGSYGQRWLGQAVGIQGQ